MATKAELEARIAQLEREKAERAEREEEQKRSSNFSNFLSFLPSVGSIITLLLAGLLLYTLGKNETVQKFIEDTVRNNFEPDTQLKIFGYMKQFGLADHIDMGKMLTDAPPEHFRKALASHVSPDILKVVAKDKETKDSFLALVREENGGKLDDMSAITSPKTIYALMTKQPKLVQELIATMKPGQAAGKEAQQITASLKVILADEQKFATLVSPQHRADTAQMIAGYMKTKNINLSAEVVERMIVSQLDAQQQPKPELRTMVLSALDGNFPGSGQATTTTTAGATGAGATPAAGAQQAAGTGSIITAELLLSTVDRTQLKTDLEKQCYDAAVANPALIQRIMDTAGTDKLLALLRAEDPVASMQKMLFDPSNAKALPHLCAFAGKVEALKSVLPIDPKLLGDFLEKTGYSNGQPNESLKALLTEIAKDPKDMSIKRLEAPLTQYLLAPEIAKNAETLPAFKALLNGFQAKTNEEKALQADLNKLTPKMLVALSNIKANKVDPIGLLNDVTVRDDDGSKAVDTGKVLGALAEKHNRDVFRQAGIDNIAALVAETSPAMAVKLTARNMNAALTLIDKLEANNTGNPATTARANTVLSSLMTWVAYPNTKLLGGVPSTTTAAFFDHPGNIEIVGAFWNSIDMRQLPPGQRQLAETIRDTWGSKKGGIARLMTSAPAIDAIVKNAPNQKDTVSCTAAAKADAPVGFWNSLLGPEFIGEQRHEINALAKAFALANCTSETAMTAIIPPRNPVVSGRIAGVN